METAQSERATGEQMEHGQATTGPIRTVESITGPVRTVETTTVPEQATEPDRIAGRVIEAKGTAADGGRIFRVRIIKYGDSLNARRYPEAVMRAAASMYEGAKAYDRHRSEAEMRSGTIQGLVGYFAGVAAEPDGLYADLRLLPSAGHAAEALDATLASQSTGREPLIGLSHDVLAAFRTVTENGVQMQEATEIVRVNSADLVADPAAGGMVARMVANNDPTGTAAADAAVLHDVSTGRGRAVVAQEVAARGLAAETTEHLIKMLPPRFSEAQLGAAIDAVKAAEAAVERRGLAPSVVQVTKEARDKKRGALDAFFGLPNAASPPYRSLREAYIDFSGTVPRFLDEDLNMRIMADSSVRYDASRRTAESLDTTSWAQALGDSISRRMIAEYALPTLQAWRQIVSSIATGIDFRTQRLPRVGGYGTLPVVNAGAPYQPLTSPPDEEVLYSVSKRGGTEDLTLEMIANDDIRAIRRIPVALGRAAAQTLYRFVFDLMPSNAAVSYDGVPLFHASHNNLDNPAVLAQATLTAARKKMRKQARYGDAADILSIIPRWLIVPTDLEEVAFQLTQSVSAIPASSNDPADRPNINAGVDPIVIDYYSDVNDWYMIADPSMCPTIEVGFYGSTPDPELFTQSDPNVGSMFNADVLTFKIRHAYSGAVLDHRAFYKGGN